MRDLERRDDERKHHPSESPEQCSRRSTFDVEATTDCGSVRSIALVMLCGLLLQIYLIGRYNVDGDASGRMSLSHIHSHRHVETAEPILIMGLPNSGSLALHRYFQCRGMTSQHYCCGGGDSSEADTKFPCPASTTTCGQCVLTNMKERKLPFEKCHPSHRKVQVWSSFDVETQDEWFLPQHFAIGLLHEAYPNATWILNERSSSQAWAESILHWHSKTRRLFASYRLPLHPHPIPPPPNSSEKVPHDRIVRDMERALQERVYNVTDHRRKLTVLRRLYQNHSQTIRLWARQFPLQHRLLVINVDDPPSIILQALDEVFAATDDEKGNAAKKVVSLTGIMSSNIDLKNSNQTKCSWSFEPPDNDWMNFELPF